MASNVPAGFCGETYQGMASYYGREACRANNTSACLMANGESLYEKERKKESYAASWVYPMGSRIKVTNPSNGKYVICKICDRGPAKRLKRVIDLDKRSFAKISALKSGIVNVKTEVVK